MNVTRLSNHGELAAALAALDRAGIEYTEVCSGTEPICADGTPVAA